MDKKKLNYLLIPAVLLLWGVIGYKLLKGIKRENINSISSRIDIPKSVIQDDNDNYVLINNYHDPFLDNWYVKGKKQVEKPINTIPSSILTPKRNNNFIPKNTYPTNITYQKTDILKYHGIISNTLNGEKIYFFTLNGEQVILHSSKEQLGIRVIKSIKDSVFVRMKGKRIELKSVRF
jgi:hypothetical protein